MLVTEKQKKELVDEHFYYEVCELRMALIILSKYVEFNNIRHDSFLLHARALREFFFPPNKSKWKDDAYADHFVKGWNYSLPSELKKVDTRAGKEIMHLTYSRISGVPEHKKWNFIKIYKEIANITIKFINELQPEYHTERMNTM